MLDNKEDKPLGDGDLLDILVSSGAILKGHFVLSSGLHSDTYVQCAKLQEDPRLCEHLCRMLVDKARGAAFLDREIDIVVSPAMGGVVFGYEVAKQLGVNFVFLERVNGLLALRRGFEIPHSSRVLIVEDVITTGRSSLEVADVVTSFGAGIVGELSIVDRRGSDSNMPFSVVSLLALDIKSYREEDIPEALKSLPALKPGSRYIK